MAKKVKMRRKGLVDVTELNALQQAYGKPLSFKDWKNYVGLPGLALGAFGFGLTYIWWVALLCALLGGLYGVTVILPQSVKRIYELKSLKERHRLINNLTGILMDDNKTTLKALGIAKQRLNGELRDDVALLEVSLQGTSHEEISEAFRRISKKHEKDVVFDQYLEQLETAVYEGRKNNLETLKQIKSYHNDILMTTNDFMRIKEGHFKDLKQMLGIVVVFILAITFSFDFDTFLGSFARSPIGWGTTFVYLLLLSSIMRSFFTRYFDDEVMSIGKYNTKDASKNQTETSSQKLGLEEQAARSNFSKGVEKFTLKLLGETNYTMLSEMGNTDATIAKWQRGRMVKTLLLFLASGLSYLFMADELFLAIFMGSALLMYVMQGKRISGMYAQYKFERQLQFTKFTRLLVPYLRQKSDGGNLYGTFNKILPRLEHEADRILLMRLMDDMTTNPNSLEPFTEYARLTSGTDMSEIFMQNIFDLKQGSADTSIIEDLDEMSSKELMTAVSEIIAFKSKKFSFFPTKLVMCTFLLVLGFTGAVLMYNLQDMSFG